MTRQRRGDAFAAVLAVYGGRITSALAQAVALVVLARMVTPATLGTVAVYVAVVNVIGVVADFGLQSSASRAMARGERATVAWIASYRGRSMLVAALVVALGVAVARVVDSSFITGAFFLLAPWLLVETFNSLLLSLAVADQRSVHAAVSMTIGRLLALGAFFLVARQQWFDPVTSYFLFLIVSPVLSSFMAPSVLPSRDDREPPHGLRAALKEARPFWTASLSGQVRSLDTVVLSALAGASAAGLYAFPSRAVAPLRLVATSLAAIAMPSAARRDLHQLAVLERGMWAVAIGFVALTMGFWTVGEDALSLLLGAAYGDAAPLLAVLMLGVAANIPGALWSAVLQGAGRADQVARIGFALVLVFYVLVTGGILWVGALGAAWGVTATYFTQFLIMVALRTREDWPGNR